MKKPIERAEVIMERLGFNENSSDGAKAAFLKNLIKQAYGVEVKVPQSLVETKPQTFADFTASALNKKADPIQLSFNFDSGNSPKAG